MASTAPDAAPTVVPAGEDDSSSCSSADQDASCVQDFLDMMGQCEPDADITISSKSDAHSPVATESSVPTAEEFDTIYRNKRPFVLMGESNESHWHVALNEWVNDDNLGSLDCLEEPFVFFAHDNTHFLKNELTQSSRFPFADGISHVLQQDTSRRAYLRTSLDKFDDRLAHTVPIDHIAQMCSTQKDQESTPNALSAPFKASNCGLWISSPGCVTPLHFDLCHGFLCQIRGTKRVLLFAPTDLRSLYINPPDGPNPNTSQVDIAAWLEEDADQQKRFPKVANADPYEHLLQPGEALYIPPFWWHHVSTMADPACSVLLPFDPDMSRGEGVHPCIED